MMVTFCFWILKKHLTPLNTISYLILLVSMVLATISYLLLKCYIKTLIVLYHCCMGHLRDLILHEELGKAVPYTPGQIKAIIRKII